MHYLKSKVSRTETHVCAIQVLLLQAGRAGGVRLHEARRTSWERGSSQPGHAAD